MGVVSLGITSSSASDLANEFAPAQVGGLTPILQEILHTHQHLGLRLQIQLQGWEGDVKSVRAGLAQVRLRTRPIGLPQGQGGALEPGQTPAYPGWAGPRPSPAPLCTQGIITFGEVKGSSPHPARPHGPGTVCRGTPHSTPICTCRHCITMPDTRIVICSL